MFCVDVITSYVDETKPARVRAQLVYPIIALTMYVWFHLSATFILGIRTFILATKVDTDFSRCDLILFWWCIVLGITAWLYILTFVLTEYFNFKSDVGLRTNLILYAVYTANIIGWCVFGVISYRSVQLQTCKHPVQWFQLGHIALYQLGLSLGLVIMVLFVLLFVFWTPNKRVGNVRFKSYV